MEFRFTISSVYPCGSPEIFHHFREGATYAFKLMNFAEIFFKGISQTAWTYKYIAEKKSLY